MSSLAYLHQTNILYSRISAKNLAEPAEQMDADSNEAAIPKALKTLHELLTPTTQHLKTLFLPYKGQKRAFIMRQYRTQQARLKAFTRRLLFRLRRVV